MSKLRADFPVLQQQVHGKPLVYLDTAATAQMPVQVEQAISHYTRHDRSNIHRGVHALSQRATKAYEAARTKIQRFINAKESREVIFTSGTTEGINLVAQSWGRRNLAAGDEILITEMEHHSNIVPWQLICEERGCHLRVAPVNDVGEIDLPAFEKLLGPKTKLVALAHVSNALGTINPVKEIIAKVRAHSASPARTAPAILIDGAQAVAHLPVDVQALDCDFYAFSAHKLYGPTGIGVLYGKAAVLESMPPYQGGGDMIRSVSFEKTTYNDIPYKFEAGTPNIGGVIGFGAAIDYLQQLGFSAVFKHEDALLHYATERLQAINRLRIIGTAKNKTGVVSFVIDNVHPHDIGTVLDCEGIAIRAGHHCAQPLMDRFHVPATARMSLGLYNTRVDIDSLVNAIHKVLEVFR